MAKRINRKANKPRSRDKADSKSKSKTNHKLQAKSKPAVKAAGKSSGHSTEQSKTSKMKTQSKNVATSKGGASAASTGKKTVTKANGQPSKSLKKTSGVVKVSRQAKKSLGLPSLPVVVSVAGARPPQSEQPMSVDQLRKVKTGLTKRDLDKFRRLLLAKRAEIVGDVTFMQSDVCNKHDDGTLSHMPVHMADLGSDNYEQEFTLGLVESGRQLLREIDDALARMELGIYGVCMETGTPIGKSRLEAKPWAKYCVEAARQLERRRKG